jgi:hypothetical protein
MLKNDPQPPPSALSGSSRRGRLSAAVITFVVASSAVIGFLVSQGDNNPSPIPSDQVAGSGTTSTTSTATTISTQIEVTSRLREILQVRDEALLARDADLLSGIYTVDCLEDGRALINQLLQKNIVWRGVRTEVAVTNTEEVNDRLWIVVATIQTPSVRIETESGQLIRIVPPERNRVRFALAKPQNEKEWLLGHASTFD